MFLGQCSRLHTSGAVWANASGLLALKDMMLLPHTHTNPLTNNDPGKTSQMWRKTAAIFAATDEHQTVGICLCQYQPTIREATLTTIFAPKSKYLFAIYGSKIDWMKIISTLLLSDSFRWSILSATRYFFSFPKKETWMLESCIIIWGSRWPRCANLLYLLIKKVIGIHKCDKQTAWALFGAWLGCVSTWTEKQGTVTLNVPVNIFINTWGSLF